MQTTPDNEKPESAWYNFGIIHLPTPNQNTCQET